MAKQRYKFETSNRDTGLGQIERGLALLGFRVVDAAIDGGDINTGEPYQYRVVFEPGIMGTRGTRESDSKIKQIQGLIQGGGAPIA